MFRSDAAEALRTRLLKYRDKLFTFLRHDGVPWNNNNAENAIRQFAYYREETPGVLTETGLRAYLMLLSIYQTCRYKGISFLRFLLSRDRASMPSAVDHVGGDGDLILRSTQRASTGPAVSGRRNHQRPKLSIRLRPISGRHLAIRHPTRASRSQVRPAINLPAGNFYPCVPAGFSCALPYHGAKI